MSTQPDYAQAAADFLKRWQTQMTKQLHDPDVIRSMLAAMNSFGAPAHDETARHPAAASDAGDGAIKRLADRLDAVERQLAKLHAQLLSVDAKAKNSARATDRSSKRTSGKSAKPVERSKQPVARSKRGVAGAVSGTGKSKPGGKAGAKKPVAKAKRK